MSNHARPRQLSLGEQIGRMRAAHPQFSATWHHNTVLWTGTLQPTDGADRYTLRITYPLGRSPKVLVLKPVLETLPGTRIPHRFRDGSLCLYYPRLREWHPGEYVATTIVPWASLWLFHYEAWLATGTWHGGGHEGPK